MDRIQVRAIFIPGEKVTDARLPTDNRIGVAELTMPPRTPGPPPHWHEMHDETFYITKGSVRFHVPDASEEGKDKKIIDAKTGDYVVVPIRAPHTFR